MSEIVIYYSHMLKQLKIRTLIDLVAEQRLSGCKARVERVMAEWLKTLYLVVSMDLSLKDWTLPESLWVNQ